MNDLLMSVEAERKDPEDAVALQVGLWESERDKQTWRHADRRSCSPGWAEGERARQTDLVTR